jgi:NADH-quinone oxidoreductase subunit H
MMAWILLPAAQSGAFGHYYDPGAPITGAPWLWATIIKMIIVFTVIMVTVAMLTLAERKISAWIQDRHGPNRVGPHGLLQPAADGLKNIMKEETYPEAAYKPLFILAPAMAFVPALLTFAVIPFAAPLPTRWGYVDMVVADVPVGFLYILAITSLGVYGIVLAGWSSNNKYSLLGGLRSSAQMVSYEVAMGLSTVAVLLLAGNVSLKALVEQQVVSGWNVFPLLIGFFIFLVAAFAETNRLPFDLPEAESELIAGYHTEYSAMKFSMFFIAEYSNMVTASALMTTLFFGGWGVPFWTAVNTPPWALWKTLITLAVFVVKVTFFLFLYMWIRWTLPRFRYDQLMSLGWKFMLPLGLAYIAIMSGAILGLEALGISPAARWLGVIPVYWASLGVLNVVLAVLVFVILDRGHILSPAYSRMSAAELARLRLRIRQARLAAAGGD